MSEEEKEEDRLLRHWLVYQPMLKRAPDYFLRPRCSLPISHSSELSLHHVVHLGPDADGNHNSRERIFFSPLCSLVFVPSFSILAPHCGYYVCIHSMYVCIFFSFSRSLPVSLLSLSPSLSLFPSLSLLRFLFSSLFSSSRARTQRARYIGTTLLMTRPNERSWVQKFPANFLPNPAQSTRHAISSSSEPIRARCRRFSIVKIYILSAAARTRPLPPLVNPSPSSPPRLFARRSQCSARDAIAPPNGSQQERL